MQLHLPLPGPTTPPHDISTQTSMGPALICPFVRSAAAQLPPLHNSFLPATCPHATPPRPCSLPSLRHVNCITNPTNPAQPLQVAALRRLGFTYVFGECRAACCPPAPWLWLFASCLPTWHSCLPNCSRMACMRAYPSILAAAPRHLQAPTPFCPSPLPPNQGPQCRPDYHPLSPSFPPLPFPLACRHPGRCRPDHHGGGLRAAGAAGGPGVQAHRRGAPAHVHLLLPREWLGGGLGRGRDGSVQGWVGSMLVPSIFEAGGCNGVVWPRPCAADVYGSSRSLHPRPFVPTSVPSNHCPLPIPVPCVQGWIGFVETCAPEIIPHISTCKSPHMMVGAVLKTYFAEVGGVWGGRGRGNGPPKQGQCMP